MNITQTVKRAARPAKGVAAVLLLGVALYFVACVAMGYFAGLHGMDVPVQDTSELQASLSQALGQSS